MDRRGISGFNSDTGFDKLICEDDLNNEESSHCPPSNPGRRQVSMPSMTPSRLAAVSLVVLAVILLIVDISLGVHYNKLTDTHLTTEDVERISSDMKNLQDTYKTSVNTTKYVQKQLASEMNRQKPTNWELEHQKKRQTDYEAQIDKITKDIASMRSHLPMINNGCRQCPPGWILMNSVCYYFSFSDTAGVKTWQKARQFCQMHGGDLAVLDSKDKESSTVSVLINNQDFSLPLNGFWIGLRDLQEEGTWKWVDGKELVEGYWNDGEPNDIDNEDCAAVYPRENFFKAWNDVGCRFPMKWICEKAPNPQVKTLCLLFICLHN
ncbi:hypothetical protein Q5P01_020340 [Channa striata]|uniref:C-type lectin domain-containing protein n=1 Tax=Channa striata TaxID=64152 RepID=A0AA88LXD6_CHASR|nr:hypothetical protein Q5P01_020340 [Channa striata]